MELSFSSSGHSSCAGSHPLALHQIRLLHVGAGGDHEPPGVPGRADPDAVRMIRVDDLDADRFELGREVRPDSKEEDAQQVSQL